MGAIVLPLIAGFLLSYHRVKAIQRLPYSTVTDVSLLFLLFVMGARIGGDAEVVKQAAQIGQVATVLALVCVAASILVVFVLERTVLSKYSDSSVSGMADLPTDDSSDGVVSDSGVTAPESQPDSREGSAHNSLTVRLLGAVAAGIVIGLLLVHPIHLDILSRITTWILGLLLFGVGLELGESGKIMSDLKVLGLQVLLLPAGIAAGSILAAVLLVHLLDLMPHNEAAALASGFGWYSLSAVIITEIHSSALGAMAFLTNVIRELIAIVITPAIADRVGKLSSVAPGGATTMDVTLAVVGRAAGRKYIPVAFISGLALTALVPVLVRLFLALG